jgi:hypothetical protein
MFSDFIRESCSISVDVVYGSQGEPLNPILKFTKDII